MKRYLFTVCLIAVSMGAFSQFSFGLRGGININNFNIKSDYYTSQELGLGFVGGIFGRFTLGKYFLEPSVLYSRRNSNFTYSPAPGVDTVFNTNTSYLDVPIHFGREFFKVLTLSTGPVFSNKLNEVVQYYTNDQNIKKTLLNEVFQKRNLGWQVGAEINSGLFMIDFRYEWGFGVFQSFNLPGIISTFTPEGSRHCLQVTLAMKLKKD